MIPDALRVTYNEGKSVVFTWRKKNLCFWIFFFFNSETEGGNLVNVINKYFYTSTQKILKKSLDLENYMEMCVNLHFLES